MTDKANILVLGTSGAGKSTLINAVIGKEVARINDGRRGTERLEVFESDELNLRLIDSRGRLLVWGRFLGYAENCQGYEQMDEGRPQGRQAEDPHALVLRGRDVQALICPDNQDCGICQT